jgi:prepilin-type N-terminal cleavage/methylation domain-containing protein
VLRATRSRCDDESGFTLTELLVAMAVMGLIASAIIAVAMRTMQTTLTVTDRRDVFADGRFVLDQLAKELRQAEAIDLTSDADTVSGSTYLDGDQIDVVWRTSGSSAPYTLERSQDGGATFTPLITSLNSDQLFTYTFHEGVLDQVTIDLDLSTRTSTVELTTDVYLRNAD